MDINNKNFHTIGIDECLEATKSRIGGLIADEVETKLGKYGKNMLAEGEKRSIFEMFAEQFKDVMILILIVAAAISGFLGEFADAIIIMIVVILNAFLGVFQENKAEKALDALKKMSSPYAKVKRDGVVEKIKSEELVPGDIVILEAGDFVPADIRLIEAASLKIEESSLTGESVPVEKEIAVLENADVVIGDRINMAYLSSSVTYGRGIGVVTGTGMNTEVGKIAGYISKSERETTPLQKKLTEIGKFITIGVVIIAALIFTTGIIRGHKYIEMFLIAISLAVAAIPEGLPAIVTIVLAIGVQKMAKQNAIVRKLPAVETLGSTEIICSDKTGTLTQNKMTVKEVFFSDKLISEEEARNSNHNLDIFLEALSLCNDSSVSLKENGGFKLIGDPTETALIDFSIIMGFYKESTNIIYPRKSELPFDSVRKLMSTVNEINGNLRVLTKGAPDMLLDRCSKINIDGAVMPIEAQQLEGIKNANKVMANSALRVLAVAYKDIKNIPTKMTSDEVENDLVFIGLVGMIDPPRVEVKDSVRICKEAGMLPIMITGDHRDTAFAIAKELGIASDEAQIITGMQLDEVSDKDFLELINKFRVYARVSPEHKVRIVETWKKIGKIVAMTGDGVNDAPSLKKADIGIGMGITGTDVAKGVSDMILADDNFSTIVIAVAEGRKIYSNIRKAIHFLLSANMGEVFALFVATMLNWTILFPIHILWINLVTDSFPALALGVENAEKDIMKQKPRRAESNILSGGMGIDILYQGFIQGGLTLLIYYIGYSHYNSEKIGITLAFATLGLVQLFHSFNVRSNKESLFTTGLFTNKYLIGATILSTLLQISVLLIPSISKVFKLESLNLEQWGIVLLVSASIIPIVELVKFFERKISK